MITAEVFEVINIYKELVEKVKREEVNPFEVDLKDLKDIVGENIFTNGLIISLLSKLLKLKAE